LGRENPLALVVMDGIGVGRGDDYDVVALANTPTLDRLASGSCRSLRAHGTAVGPHSDGDIMSDVADDRGAPVGRSNVLAS
jgi:2,3-bisphosphoglycerate-independent phosphoglycerate mutase